MYQRYEMFGCPVFYPYNVRWVPAVIKHLEEQICTDKKEENKQMSSAIKVSCKGFAGYLVSMERTTNYNGSAYGYKISIRDIDKIDVKYTIDFAEPQEIKFLVGEVALGG